MAQNDNYLLGPSSNPEDEKLGTVADFGKQLGAGLASDVGGGLASALRYGWELGGSEAGADIAAGLQKIFNATGEGIEGTMNPATRKLAASAMTSTEFWEHPVLATSLKATRMLPQVAAMAIPGGLMADTVAASIAASAAGGVLNAGDGINEFYQKLDKMSDAELQEQSPKYRAMRSLMDEEPARARFNREAQGWGPAINTVLGAVSGLVGPGGVAARGLAGGAKNTVIGAGERGALGSTGVAAGEGVVSNALEEGVSDITQQQAEMEASMRTEFDKARTANAALEGGALGGLFGGAVGAVTGGHSAARPPKLPVAEAVETAPTQQHTGSASTPPPMPSENAAIGNPKSAPTVSDRDAAKGKPAAQKGATPPPAAPPLDPAVVAAVSANEGKPVSAQPTEVAAMTERTPNAVLDLLDQEGKQPAAPAAPPQVPPQVPAGVTPPVAPSAEVPVQDTGMNVSEPAASIAEQIKQIGTGERKAVMMPKGTVVRAVDLGGRTDLKSMNTPRGRFIFDPKLVSRSTIAKLSAAGRENELLGLGPVSKPEAVLDAQAGATPVAITERTPAGTEVKAAAGTTATLPEQVASLEAQKSPGNVVAVETPELVIDRRNTGGGRVLRNLQQPKAEAEAVAMEPAQAPVITEEKPAGPGKNYRGKAGQERDKAIASAKEVVEAHAPNPDAEEGYHRLPQRRNVVIQRLRNMVAAYEKATGKQVQSQIKRSKDGKATSDDPNILTLRLAKDVVRHADKSPEGKAITDLVAQYKTDEALIRAGAADEVIARRLEEGDRGKRRTTQEQVEQAADETTREIDHDKREDEVVDEAEETQVGDTAAVKDKTDEEVSAREHDEADVTDSEKIEQGPSVKHVEIKLEKAKSNMSPREARKAALANIRKGLPEAAPIKNQVPLRDNAPMAMNINPTEAQKRAGNYAKIHRKVEGMDISIENPKGAVRSGVDANGKRWEVRMPADYGYIRRTEGADGDHVDVYDGRRGDRYFIVDQLDARTGAFDEHKVMARFRSEEEAVDTYMRGFSDGQGHKRLGFIYEVTPAELKTWLKQGDQSEAHAAHIMRDMDAVNFDVPEGPKAGEITSGNGVVLRPTRSSTVAQEIDLMNMPQSGTVSGALAKFFQSRLRRLAGEADVHYLSHAEMQKLWKGSISYDPKIDPGGLHVINHQTGHSEIYIRDDQQTAAERGDFLGSREHILLHEVTHAVTQRQIAQVPNARNTVRQLMRTAAQWAVDNDAQVELEHGLENIAYGFSNEAEFVAEAFSNPRFQEMLAKVPLDRETANYLGLTQRGNMSVWDGMIAIVRKIITKLTGQVPDYNVLEGIMKVGERLTTIHQADHPSPYANRKVGDTLPQEAAFDMATKAAQQVKDLLESRAARDDTPKNLALRTFNNLAEISGRYFGESNPVRKIHNAIERMRVTGERIFEERTGPIVKLLKGLEKKNPEAARELSSLMHDATVADVHPDVPLTDAKNAHLGKKRMDTVWNKAQHPELAKRYNALPEEYKQAFHTVTKHYRDQQNEMSLGIIRNMLDILKVPDGGLSQRIHEGNLTDADKLALGENLETIEKAKELSKINGPYVPLIRRGDHVVKGDYKLALPPGATPVTIDGKVKPNEFEFKTREEAERYAKASPLQAEVSKIWIDPATGERLGKEELASVDRYRVEVQNRHVEFVQGRRAAEARAAELAKDGGISVHEVVPRSREPDARQASELSTALNGLVKKLEHSPAYEAATPSQRATMRAAIEEAALASHGSTRVSSRALIRRGVRGFDENLTQNAVDYGVSSSRYLARLEHGPAMEAGLKEMAQRLDADHSKTGQYARTLISNEVRKRVDGDNGFEQGGALAPAVKRLLSLSFADKLASPAYSVINAMQPGMVTMPYLAARYGVSRAFSEMGKAYRDLNAGAVLKAGAKGTAQALRGKDGSGNLVELATRGLSADEKRMIKDHLDLGTIDVNAGMEVHSLARSYEGVGGKADAVLGYLEGVTREMPKAIEAINRTVTALATYRLARNKGASHEAATQASIDAVNGTQFNYSPTNSPGVFNHPLLKIALQFKKYGQGMYQLIGTQIGEAIRPMNPGDRARAVKTLIGIAATHMAMAGALGLPTEPFKYLVMAASPLTGVSWSDVENEIRKQAAALFGKTGGELATRGLPRFLNLDLSRMGLDSVTSFGEPRGQKEADVKSWLFDSVSGPVVSLGGDMVKGVNHLANGEVTKAAEKMIPLKVVSDSIRAYRQASEGKKTAGGKQSSAPYSPAEAGLRVLGFGTGREAEEGAQRGAYFRASEAQKEQRGNLVNAWVNAKPEAKAKAFAAITKYNQTAPAEVKITMKELTNKAKRDAKAADTSRLGINPNKRDKRFLNEDVYNTQ